MFCILWCLKSVVYILYPERLKKIKTRATLLCRRKKNLFLCRLKFSHSFSSPVSVRGASNCHVFSSNHHLVSHVKPSLSRPFTRGNAKWVALYLALVLHFCTHRLVGCKKQAVSHVLGLRKICPVGPWLLWPLTGDYWTSNVNYVEHKMCSITQVQVDKRFENSSLKRQNAKYIWNCRLS